MVFVSLFAFYILEFGRTHLLSYYWYLSEHHTRDRGVSHVSMMRLMLVFIDVIVFGMQLLVVIFWQMTMQSLLTNPTDALACVCVLGRGVVSDSTMSQDYNLQFTILLFPHNVDIRKDQKTYMEMLADGTGGPRQGFRSKVNPGSPLGQPWVSDFWRASVGPRRKLGNGGSR